MLNIHQDMGSGSEARAKGLYIGPISSSEHAPHVAFSLKVTYGNVERAKNCFTCGGLSSVLGQSYPPPTENPGYALGVGLE